MPRPREIILEALIAHLQIEVANLPADEQFTVRHWRNRNTADDEMKFGLGCLSLRWRGEDFNGEGNGGDGLSLGEDVVTQMTDLVAEVKLPSEASGEDPTGLGRCGKILTHAFNFLFTTGEQPENLGGLLWDIRYDGTSDDDDLSTEEIGRVSERLGLLYRVRTENPNVILT